MGIKSTHLTAQSFYPNYRAKRPSWLLILFMFAVFFPVAIYLLHKRVRITKGRNSAAVITYTWSILGAVFMILCIFGDGGIGYWIALAVFIFAWLVGVGDREQWKSYDSYIALLMNGEYYLPNIANAVGKSQKDVIRHLEEMFEDGIFAGSYINMAELTVVADYSCLAKMGIHAPVIKPAAAPGTDAAASSYAKIVVRCKGCGANVEGILGKTATCDFCDSPISFM